MVTKNPSLKSFLKVENFLKEYKDKHFKITLLRDTLQIDYYSLKLILEELQKRDLIELFKGGYKWKA